MAEDEVLARVRRSVHPTYDMGRELGGGGMSRVFRATERASGLEVVLKVLPPDLAADISLARFRREIDVAARMRHANIVPVLCSGEAEGLPWFAMPFVEGETLRERVGSSSRLTIAEAMRILRDMASALAYAHRKGIVHRDIKPENVLLSANGAVITDFGVAKALLNAEGGETDNSGPKLTTRRIALGTPTYMSPEQASGDPRVGTRADIYAWGIVAYELLAGQTPFDGRSLHGQLRAHVSEAPVSLAVHRPSTPAQLVDLVHACLKKSPASRPQLADLLVEALDSISVASSTTTLPSGMPSVEAEVPVVTAPHAPAVAVPARTPSRGVAPPSMTPTSPVPRSTPVSSRPTTANTALPARQGGAMVPLLIGAVIVVVMVILLLRTR